MTHTNTPRGPLPERLDELLAMKAIEGLSPQEAQELAELLAREGLDEQDVSLEPAAAAAALAIVGELEPMPDHVAGAVVAAWDRAGSGGPGVLRVVGPGSDQAGAAAPARASRVGAMAGWLVAACLALAVGVWVNTRPTPPVMTAARVRAQGDAVRLAWGAWDSPEVPVEVAGVTGELDWSETLQGGVMRFRGLRVNDPAKEQYQLWIIDSRGMEQRISGAIFDAHEGEVEVPIQPGIGVKGAVAFAVTIEKPGGTWVSDMKRRVVIAARKG